VGVHANRRSILDLIFNACSIRPRLHLTDWTQGWQGCRQLGDSAASFSKKFGLDTIAEILFQMFAHLSLYWTNFWTGGSDRLKKDMHSRLQRYLSPLTSRRPSDCLGRDFIHRSIPLVLLLATIATAWAWSSGQTTSDATETVRGIVINSITREPISRALVTSPDNRFATLTNSEGRFEFTPAKIDQASGNGGSASEPVAVPPSDRPYTLTARKPGFIADPYNQVQTLQNNAGQDLTLTLIPESLIVGTVALPTLEAPDSIGLQLYKRQIRVGRVHWIQAGNAQSSSDGHFRFAELEAGTYKLLTLEFLDRDPVTSQPADRNPDAAGPLLGYPPVYYQSAPDFDAASPISLAAGQTLTVNLSLAKQAYYRVRVPVFAPGGEAPENGLAVTVSAHGHGGPGFSLGYNNTRHAIEGSLPNGSYSIEAMNFGSNGISGMSGRQTISIQGRSFEGPALFLVPNGSIPVSVREEFTSPDPMGAVKWQINGRNTTVTGPRRYLRVNLESADDFAAKPSPSLRMPDGSKDDNLVVEGVSAGTYWVQVTSSRGYPASVRSGNLDLLRQPLVVGVGDAASPIEITMRDDFAEISGTVSGIPQQMRGASQTESFGPGSAAMIYFFPLPDSSGELKKVAVQPDGSFVAPNVVPGAYRLLAFDREQIELDNLNPEAMQAYESKGPVVRVIGGQKERVTLQLISTEHF
jgi:hypothetical protein